MFYSSTLRNRGGYEKPTAHAHVMMFDAELNLKVQKTINIAEYATKKSAHMALDLLPSACQSLLCHSSSPRSNFAKQIEERC